MSYQDQADQPRGTSTGPSPWAVVLWLGAGALAVGLVLGLSAISDDAVSVMDWVTALGILVIGGTSTGGMLQARRAVKQTNGTLDRRIDEQMSKVLRRHGILPGDQMSKETEGPTDAAPARAWP